MKKTMNLCKRAVKRRHIIAFRAQNLHLGYKTLTYAIISGNIYLKAINK